MQPGSFDWDELRLVLAVSESRGLAGAAERLGIDPSTAFRKLGQLERRLGIKLFERRRTGYGATAAGADMAALAARMREEADGLARRMAGQAADPTGEVRITTNDALLIGILTPNFARIRLRHPGIRLDVVLSNEALNLSRRDADLAIRVTPSPPDSLVGRKMGLLSWALYGRGDDPANAPGAFDPGDLAGRDWVGVGDALADIPAARYLRERVPPERVVYRVSSVLGLVEAVEAGIGIGPLPCYTADRSPHLVRLSDPLPDLTGTLWILTHPDLRHSPRVRALMDSLAEELARERPVLAA